MNALSLLALACGRSFRSGVMEGQETAQEIGKRLCVDLHHTLCVISGSQYSRPGQFA